VYNVSFPIDIAPVYWFEY